MVGLVASISAVDKKNKLFFCLHLSKKEAVFCYFTCLISVQLVFHIYIFYRIVQILRSLSTYFINKYITNILFWISCGIDALDQQVEYSLIRTFRLLKQILPSLGCLFHERNSRYLELSFQLELFPRFRDSSIYRESTVDSFRRIISLSNR